MTAVEQKAMPAGEQKAEEQADPRVMEVVVALVPAPGGVIVPTEEQKKVGLEVWKLVEAAIKKAADAVKAPDKGELEQAGAKFFAGDLAAAEAKKKAEAEGKAAQHSK